MIDSNIILLIKLALYEQNVYTAFFLVQGILLGFPTGLNVLVVCHWRIGLRGSYIGVCGSVPFAAFGETWQTQDITNAQNAA